MIILASTSDKVQLITGGTETVDIHTSYMDYNGTTVTPGRKNSNVSSAVTTDIVAAPGSSIQRNVKTINVRNKDAAPAAIIIQHVDGANTVELFSTSLLANSELQYTDALGWLQL
jgi:hypothetical protein